MSKQIDKFNQDQLKKDLPDVRSGDVVKIHQRIKDGEKERIQIFEGIVLTRKHGQGINSTITVRKIVSGIGVERIFPVHSPSIAKIEIVKRGKARRAKLYFLKTAKGKRARLKRAKEFPAAIAPETVETPEQEEQPAEVTEQK